MCLTCTLEEVSGLEREEWPEDWEDSIVWPVVTDEMKLLARLCWALHECTSATTGGPVHIFTDDSNVEDSNLDFCAEHIANPDEYNTGRDDWDLVRAVSLRILELARPMTNAQRAVALSLSWGEIKIDQNNRVIWK